MSNINYTRKVQLLLQHNFIINYNNRKLDFKTLAEKYGPIETLFATMDVVFYNRAAQKKIINLKSLVENNLKQGKPQKNMPDKLQDLNSEEKAKELLDYVTDGMPYWKQIEDSKEYTEGFKTFIKDIQNHYLSKVKP
jgi:hypothetical protein